MRLSIVLGLLVGLVGCGTSKTAPVDGTIVFSDKPEEPATDLVGYKITFEPMDGMESSTGIVGKDGKFVMSTFKEGDGGLKGKMKVAVNPPTNPRSSSPMPTMIDPRHHSPDTSGLEVEVGAGPNAITLKVDRVK